MMWPKIYRIAFHHVALVFLFLYLHLPGVVLFTSARLYQVGDQVFYFHREYRNKDDQSAYAAVLDRSFGIYRPRMGKTEGWMPGEIVSAHKEISSGSARPATIAERTYKVKSTWPDWVDAKGVFCCADEESRQLHLFRKDLTESEIKPSMPPTALTILAFRWGGRYVPATKESEFLATSPNFLYQFTDLGLKEVLGSENYEVWSFWVSTPDECFTLAKSFHLIVNPIMKHSTAISSLPAASSASSTTSHLSAGGRNIGAPAAPAGKIHTDTTDKIASMWLLHPSSFDFLSEPMYQTGSAYGAGYVEQAPMFDLMRAAERFGIYTAFPHNALLYQQLAAKSWTSGLALDPKFAIPASVNFPRVFVKKDPAQAAEKAVQVLEKIKRKQQRNSRRHVALIDDLGREKEKCPSSGFWMQDDLEMESSAMHQNRNNYGQTHSTTSKITKGVAKLGYSWEALDVKLWNNVREQNTNTSRKRYYPLSSALSDLSDSITISNQYVGQAHLLDWILIQEFIPHAVELRLYYLKNELKQVWYTRFDKVKANNEFGDFYYMDESVAISYLRGDLTALRQATEKAKIIAEDWLDWLMTQSGETVIPAVRFDFFVQYFPYANAEFIDASGNHEMVLDDEQNSAISEPWTTYEEEHDLSVQNTNNTNHRRKTKQDYENLPQRGSVKVFTLEICEAGFSIFGSEALKKEKMKTIVQNALDQG
ncbi:unnamed protein product [Amoebophrya sp. A120]|nr:unnamed protein product [Amoebophrya sp. A120]|eukprot:GSA120T00014032001.1